MTPLARILESNCTGTRNLISAMTSTNQPAKTPLSWAGPPDGTDCTKRPDVVGMELLGDGWGSGSIARHELCDRYVSICARRRERFDTLPGFEKPATLKGVIGHACTGHSIEIDVSSGKCPDCTCRLEHPRTLEGGVQRDTCQPH